MFVIPCGKNVGAHLCEDPIPCEPDPRPASQWRWWGCDQRVPHHGPSRSDGPPLFEAPIICMGRGREGEAGLDAEELLQRRIDAVRLLLWDEVPAIDAEAAHVVGVVAPHLEDVIAASLPATHSPQHQHRHPDLLREVRTVVYEVDRRAGAVLISGNACLPAAARSACVANG